MGLRTESLDILNPQEALNIQERIRFFVEQLQKAYHNNETPLKAVFVTDLDEVVEDSVQAHAQAFIARLGFEVLYAAFTSYYDSRNGNLTEYEQQVFTEIAETKNEIELQEPLAKFIKLVHGTHSFHKLIFPYLPSEAQTDLPWQEYLAWNANLRASKESVQGLSLLEEDLPRLWQVLARCGYPVAMALTARYESTQSITERQLQQHGLIKNGFPQVFSMPETIKDQDIRAYKAFVLKMLRRELTLARLDVPIIFVDDSSRTIDYMKKLNSMNIHSLQMGGVWGDPSEDNAWRWPDILNEVREIVGDLERPRSTRNSNGKGRLRLR